MTSPGFVLRLAWREARAARRRLALLTASVTAGVGALVAVNSFTDNLTSSVAEQAEALLGADLSLGTRQPIDSVPMAQALVDSLQRVGGPAVNVASNANLVAMAYRPDRGGARLVQLRTTGPGWPYYGAITTNPAGVWPQLQHGGAIADPSLLAAIGAAVGDTLALGDGRFPILGTVVSVPGDIGLQLAFGPRVYIATDQLAGTHLLSFGSQVQYTTYLRLPPTIDPQRVARRNAPVLRRKGVSVHTIADDRDTLTHRLVNLGNFLGLVALAALLLGGLGVASAVHVFIRQQLDTIAVLRTLGTTSWQIFGVYLLLALAMGLAGSLLGALLGIGLQQLMPLVVADFLPVSVHVVPSGGAVMAGILLGVWTAGVFALIPLLGIRAISPLATLRRDVDPPPVHWDVLRALAALALAGSVVALSAVQIGSLRRGAFFAAAIGAAVLVLWLASLALIRGARHGTPRALPYLWRQGLANLHRPANQTVTVVLALGFGAFLLTTIFTVQDNLLRNIRIEDVGTIRANLVLFDIQTGQRPLIDSLIRAQHATATPFTPIVPMRIRDLNGRPVAPLLARADSDRIAAERPDGGGRNGRGRGGVRRGVADSAGPSVWAMRREYRSTYRATTGSGETVTAGHWFGPADTGSGRSPADPVSISMESGLAHDLALDVGDRVTWDVQGVPIYSRITSLRDVSWARFEPNFFVVFAPGALDRAPQSWVTMVQTPGTTALGRLERTVAQHAANVTSIDLGEIQHAIETVISRVVLAIRFMALFSLATGAVVLIGAIATSRWQRIRESTLLRTLGATRAQVLRILCVEYAALGFGGAVVAVVLAGGGGWALAKWFFDVPFALPWRSMLLLAAALVLLTTVIGLWNSLDVLRRPPLEVLRAE
jgi:putative ABC transport system permease protein